MEVQSILGNVEALDIDLPEIQSLDAHEIIKAKLEEAKKHHKTIAISQNPIYRRLHPQKLLISIN